MAARWFFEPSARAQYIQFQTSHYRLVHPIDLKLTTSSYSRGWRSATRRSHFGHLNYSTILDRKVPRLPTGRKQLLPRRRRAERVFFLIDWVVGSGSFGGLA